MEIKRRQKIPKILTRPHWDYLINFRLHPQFRCHILVLNRDKHQEHIKSFKNTRDYLKSKTKQKIHKLKPLTSANDSKTYLKSNTQNCTNRKDTVKETTCQKILS